MKHWWKKIKDKWLRFWTTAIEHHTLRIKSEWVGFWAGEISALTEEIEWLEATQKNMEELLDDPRWEETARGLLEYKGLSIRIAGKRIMIVIAKSMIGEK